VLPFTFSSPKLSLSLRFIFIKFCNPVLHKNDCVYASDRCNWWTLNATHVRMVKRQGNARRLSCSASKRFISHDPSILKKSIIFWNMTPCSPLSFNRRFGGTYRLHLQKPASNQVAKIEAICSSETSVDTQRTKRRHIPKDDILHNHRCENLKSYIQFLFVVNIHHVIRFQTTQLIQRR
jgi:hypothetical protein